MNRYRNYTRSNARRLRSEIESPDVEEEVLELADWRLGLNYEDIGCFYEHGQWFVQAWDPREERQANFSVVDTTMGLDLEKL